jgi:hypothetical protein
MPVSYLGDKYYLFQHEWVDPPSPSSSSRRVSGSDPDFEMGRTVVLSSDSGRPWQLGTVVNVLRHSDNASGMITTRGYQGISVCYLFMCDAIYCYF